MSKKNNSEITSYEQAKQAMNEINNCDNQLAEIYQKEAYDIAKARMKFHTGKTNSKRQELEALKKEKEKLLLAWSKKDRENWGGIQSKKTPFGSFGFRKGQPCVALIKKVSKNFDQALEKVKKFIPGYVRKKEEIDKEKILIDFKKFDKEKLADCGMKIDQKEPFFIKTLSTDSLEEAANKLKSA